MIFAVPKGMFKQNTFLKRCYLPQILSQCTKLTSLSSQATGFNLNSHFTWLLLHCTLRHPVAPTSTSPLLARCISASLTAHSLFQNSLTLWRWCPKGEDYVQCPRLQHYTPCTQLLQYMDSLVSSRHKVLCSQAAAWQVNKRGGTHALNFIWHLCHTMQRQHCT